MNVYWLLCRVFKLTGPTGLERYAATLDRIDFEDWVYTDEDGVDHAVKFPVARYPFAKSYAYNEDGPPYTVALCRAEVPTGMETTIKAPDRVQVINTPAKWAALAANYPNLLERFSDQPTG